MVETTEVDGTTLKVIRDRGGKIKKCIPASQKELLVSELNMISDVTANADVDGVDIWIMSRDRLMEMGIVFRRLYEHGYVPRSGKLDREYGSRRGGSEKPGFIYAMPESTVHW